MRTYRNRNRLLMLCVGVGFLIGIIYENIVSGKQVVISELFLKSNLQRYLQTDIIIKKYLWYVVKERVFFLAIVCLLGCMRWKKVFVICLLSMFGFLGGILTVSAVIQLGMKGILFCLIGILPHGLFYGIGYSILINYWFRFPERQWNRTKMLFLVVMFLVGIIVETYVNPILVKWVIRVL